MLDKTFFDKSTEASRLKSRIVTKYFYAWATALKRPARARDNKLAYFDLFSGPGHYKDGVKSTPLLILESIIRHPELREMVVPVFNDSSSTNASHLAAAIEALPGINALKYTPIVSNDKVDQTYVDYFMETNMVPTLFFVDPWGYKGLSLDLIWSVLRNWGSDCIFFFNYRRVNAGLPNPYLNDPIDALFSPGQADELREAIKDRSVDERETVIIEAITTALNQKGGKFVQGFRFRDEHGTRTSHFLIFVTKNALGLKIMKEIMAAESKEGSEVASFEFNPKKKTIPSTQIDMFSELFGPEAQPDPISELAEELTKLFYGMRLTVEKIYQKHHQGRPFVQANYKSALLRLEEEKKIICIPSAENRPQRKGKSTLAENVTIVFPKKAS